MAWVKLEGYPAHIGIQPSGKLEWNDTSHVLLGAPYAVQLFHDAAENRLGLRKHSGEADEHCLMVHETVNADTGYMVFSVEAFRHLANAGVSVAQLYAAPLQEPEPFVPPDGEGDSAIWWIDLP